MVDTRLLKSKIVLSGMTQRELAKKLEIDPCTLNCKLNNKSGRTFSVNEAEKLGDLLNIKASEMSKIFFA